MSPMNPRATLIVLGSIAIGCLLPSCGSVPATGDGTGTAASNPKPSFGDKLTGWVKIPKFPKIPEISMPDFMPGDRVKVVEVREKDLRELPTGREKALAYNQERKRGFWIFGGPVDFKEPDLPVPGSESDGSLLPPKTME